MTPADMFVFVEQKRDGLLTKFDTEQAAGTITAVGKKCSQVTVPFYHGGQFGFKKGVTKEETILFRPQNILWKFSQEGKTIGALPVKDILCCQS